MMMMRGGWRMRGRPMMMRRGWRMMMHGLRMISGGSSSGRVNQRHDCRKGEPRHCHSLDEGPTAYARFTLRVAGTLIAHLRALSGIGISNAEIP